MFAGKYHKHSPITAVTIAVFCLVFFLVLLILFSWREGSVSGPVRSTAIQGGNLANDRQSEEEEADGIPVLCYHYLRERTSPVRFVKILGALVLNLPLLDESEIWTQNLSAFAREMEFLKERGYRVITLYELMEWKMGLRSIGKRAVVITFDDADRSVYKFAFPLLKKYGYKASVFVVTSHVGSKWRGVEVMSWDELRELKESGVFTIESHSHSLHRKVEVGGETMPVFNAYANGLLTPETGTDGREAVRKDLEMSRRLIMKETGSGSRFLAWPYGFGGAEADSIALLAGFYGIGTLEAGYNRRIVGPGDDQKSIEDRILSAGYDVFTTDAFGEPGGPAGGSRTAGISGSNYKIRRYTVTARTSMSDFKRMLRGEVKWLSRKR